MTTITNSCQIPIGQEFEESLPTDWDSRVELGRSFVRRVLLDYWELGRHLLETRELYQYGLWGRYLTAIGVDDSSAAAYMDLAFKYSVRESLVASGHQTLRAALADGRGPNRPRRDRKAALPASAEPSLPSGRPARTAQTDVSDVGDLGRDADEDLLPRGPLHRLESDATAAGQRTMVHEHRSPHRATWLLDELRQCPPEYWANEILDLAEEAMGAGWLMLQLRARCGQGKPAGDTALELELPMDLEDGRTPAMASDTSGDLAAALAELGYYDGDGVMDDNRAKGGTCKLTPALDREELRPQVEGPLAQFRFHWKPAKGNKSGFYWTDHGKLEHVAMGNYPPVAD